MQRVALLLVILLLLCPVWCESYDPFGFQSKAALDDSSNSSFSDDSYAGSMQFDPAHNLLYITGATYGITFDGVVPTSSSELEENVSRTHRSDCFVAALTVPDMQLVYARNFGTTNPEACSTLALLPLLSPNSSDDDGTTLLHQKVVALGHTESDHGLMTNLRKTGTNRATLYGYALDINMTITLKRTQENIVKTMEGTFLGGNLFHESEIQYPIALAYSSHSIEQQQLAIYVALLTADSDDLNPEWEYTLEEESDSRLHNHPDYTVGGGMDIPKYGSNFVIVLQKLIFKTKEEIDVEKMLTTEKGDEEGITNTMKVSWSEKIQPVGDDNVRVADMLYLPITTLENFTNSTTGGLVLVSGTTSGYGKYFGSTNDNNSMSDGDSHGFVTKLNSNTGKNEFFSSTENINSTYSTRIQSMPGAEEVIKGMCVQKSIDTLTGTMSAVMNVSHFYVVGYTTGPLDRSITTSKNLTSDRPSFHAFLMKMDVQGLKKSWVRQLGTVSGEDMIGDGCEVTLDGQSVYMAGTVFNGGAVKLLGDDAHKGEAIMSAGGDDIFVASFQTLDGSLNYVQQIGTKEDDSLARGKGITSDMDGNAIVLGTTRGSLMRFRDRMLQGFFADDLASADIFVMSFDRATGETLVPAEQKAQTPSSIPDTLSENSSSNTSKKNGLTGFGVCMVFVVCSVAVFGFVGAAYKIRKRRAELQDNDEWDKNDRVMRYLEDFDNDEVELRIRYSATGGIHGIYDFSKKMNGDHDCCYPEEVTVTLSSSMAAKDQTDSDTLNILKNALFMDDEIGDATIAQPPPSSSHDRDIQDNEDDDDDESFSGMSNHRLNKVLTRGGSKIRSGQGYQGLIDSYNKSWRENSPYNFSGALQGTTTSQSYRAGGERNVLSDRMNENDSESEKDDTHGNLFRYEEHGFRTRRSMDDTDNQWGNEII